MNTIATAVLEAITNALKFTGIIISVSSYFYMTLTAGCYASLLLSDGTSTRYDLNTEDGRKKYNSEARRSGYKLSCIVYVNMVLWEGILLGEEKLSEMCRWDWGVASIRVSIETVLVVAMLTGGVRVFEAVHRWVHLTKPASSGLVAADVKTD